MLDVEANRLDDEDDDEDEANPCASQSHIPDYSRTYEYGDETILVPCEQCGMWFYGTMQWGQEPEPESFVPEWARG